MLDKRQMQRYARQISLPEIGKSGQQKLLAAKVLVVGAGGLGSPLLLYLAAAGVGHLGIIDPDRVSASNLHRQVLFGESQLGQLKVVAARSRLLDLNPQLKVTTYPLALTRQNALELIAQYDIIADGTDNFPTRYLVNDACVLLGKPNVYGAVFRFEGQVAVFNAALPDGSRGPNYRDLFPVPPPPGQVPNCAEAGVLGVLPGMIGSMQANEVIKLITGLGEPLIGRLFLFDAASFTTRTLQFKPQPAVTITELIDYEDFCGVPAVEGLPTIDVATLMALQQSGEAFQLIDLREAAEYNSDNLGGILLPLGQLAAQQHRITRDGLVVVHCQSGSRSAQAVAWLRSQGYEQAYHLEGGILAYRAAEEEAVSKN